MNAEDKAPAIGLVPMQKPRHDLVYVPRFSISPFSVQGNVLDRDFIFILCSAELI